MNKIRLDFLKPLNFRNLILENKNKYHALQIITNK